jgi:hypothetical protein
MPVSLRATLLLVPLIGALLTTAGCGSGGGDSSAAPAPAPATTVVDGVAFAARSDVLTDSPFGESLGMRTFVGVTNGQPTPYRASYILTGTTVGGVQTISQDITYVDAQGQPITDNPILAILASILNAIGKDWAFAKAEDGWIYWVGYQGQLLAKPARLYPVQVAVGTEWSQAGVHIYSDSDGTETSVPTLTTYRVLSTSAHAPRADIGGCVLLLTVKTEEGKAEERNWRYFKVGTGFVEKTDTDPAQDQSAANGSYLISNAG